MEACFFFNCVFLTITFMSIIAILSLFHRFLLLPPALKVSVVCTLSQLTAAFSSPYLEVITLSGGAPPPP